MIYIFEKKTADNWRNIRGIIARKNPGNFYHHATTNATKTARPKIRLGRFLMGLFFWR